MKNYKCSVFCSFYKGEEFIEGYLLDICQQTIFHDSEFIFIDCASPQNEAKYIIPYVNKYDNIKYFRLDTDPGLYAGWNIAIQNTNSDIITNWNIDDRKPKDGLEILYNTLHEDESIDMVYGLNYISRIANETYEQNPKNEIYPCLDHTMQNLLNHNSPHCMPMWRKHIHEKIGLFNEKYKTVSDAAMWLVLAATGGTIKMVNRPVGLYYWNPKGQSTNPSNQQLNYIEISEVKLKIMDYLNNHA